MFSHLIDGHVCGSVRRRAVQAAAVAVLFSGAVAVMPEEMRPAASGEQLRLVAGWLAAHLQHVIGMLMRLGSWR